MNKFGLLFACTFAGMVFAVGCGGDDESGSGGGGNSSRVDDIKALTGNAMAGQSRFQAVCGISSCHGPNGNDGDATAGDLPALVPTLSDDSIISTVIDGTGSMPAQTLDDQQVADVLAYVRDTWQ